MIPFFHTLHLKCCPKTYKVQDYKLSPKTHRFEPFRNASEEKLKLTRYDPAFRDRDRDRDEE